MCFNYRSSFIFFLLISTLYSETYTILTTSSFRKNGDFEIIDSIKNDIFFKNHNLISRDVFPEHHKELLISSTVPVSYALVLDTNTVYLFKIRESKPGKIYTSGDAVLADLNRKEVFILTYLGKDELISSLKKQDFFRNSFLVLIRITDTGQLLFSRDRVFLFKVNDVVELKSGNFNAEIKIDKIERHTILASPANESDQFVINTKYSIQRN